MSYIIKKNSPLVNLKLTDTGRRNLANGALTFAKFGLGDSEVDYLTHDTSLCSILRPVDNNPEIMYPVASQGSNYLVDITNLNSIPREIKQTATERGLFYQTTGTTINPAYTLYHPMVVTSATGTTINVTTALGENASMPQVGDSLVLKSNYNGTLSTGEPGDSFTKAQTVLRYKVKSVSNVTSKSASVVVDRAVPKFTSFASAYCWSYREDLVDVLDQPDPSTYWDDSVLGFELNGVTTYDDVPVWNFNLVLIDDMIGVDPTTDKNKSQTNGKKILGTSILFKYYEEAKLDKIGVVHYTNNTVSNWYGEGFYRNSFKLKLPSVMWHKKQGGGAGLTKGAGYTFVCGTELKVLAGKVRYYDLVDQELNPSVVGKVFIDYKLAVIEDAELLMALSIKGNRNWSLPKAKLTPTEPGTCLSSSTYGAVRQGEALHVTYMLYDTNGVTPVHANDYSTYEVAPDGQILAKDVIFEFPKDPNNPLYSELGYLRNYDSTDTEGFRANRVALIWQKSFYGEQPTSHGWNIKDVTNYLGTTGCIAQSTQIADSFYLERDTILTPTTGYTLSNPAIGDIIFAVTGTVQIPADTQALITTTRPYWFDKAANKVYIDPSIVDICQIYYLSGDTFTTTTRIQKYVTPGSIPSNTYSGLYTHTATGKVSVHLDYQPSNNVVYLFYNGQLISSNNYSVYNTGLLQDRRVELNFTPAVGSTVMIYYLDAAGTGVDPQISVLTAANFNNLRVFIDKDFLDNLQNTPYNLRDFIAIPNITTDDITFGDEELLFGNVTTDIKATVFKSVMTCDVLPNQFITSTNPTFNVNQDKVQFSEIGIYDEDNDLVAIGKFSQPIARKLNSDVLAIQATIDF